MISIPWISVIVGEFNAIRVQYQRYQQQKNSSAQVHQTEDVEEFSLYELFEISFEMALNKIDIYINKIDYLWSTSTSTQEEEEKLWVARNSSPFLSDYYYYYDVDCGRFGTAFFHRFDNDDVPYCLYTTKSSACWWYINDV